MKRSNIEPKQPKVKCVNRHTGNGQKHRTDEEMKMILAKIQEVIKEVKQTNVRHLYYRLRGSGLMRNHDNEYKCTSRYTTEWRKQGIIPYGAIVDGTRFYHKVKSNDSIYEALEEEAARYKKAMWARQPKYIECWVEKDAIVSLLMPIASQYDIPIFPLRGQASQSAIFELYLTLKQQRDAGKDIKILFFGDRDDAGHKIPKSVITRLKRDFNFDVDMEVLAVTEAQIEEYGLEPEPPKNGKCTVTNCVEVDALSAPVLQGLLEAAIKKHISPEEWARCELDAKLQKETADNFMKAIKTAHNRGLVEDWCNQEILTESEERSEARRMIQKLTDKSVKLFNDGTAICEQASYEREHENRPDVIQQLQTEFEYVCAMEKELDDKIEELKREWGFYDD